jgi:hypothetical protein
MSWRVSAVRRCHRTIVSVHFTRRHYTTGQRDTKGAFRFNNGPCERSFHNYSGLLDFATVQQLTRDEQTLDGFANANIIGDLSSKTEKCRGDRAYRLAANVSSALLVRFPIRAGLAGWLQHGTGLAIIRFLRGRACSKRLGDQMGQLQGWGKSQIPKKSQASLVPQLLLA